MLIKELVTRLGFDVDFTALNKFDNKIGETAAWLKGMGSEADSAAKRVNTALTIIKNTVLGLVAASGAAGLVALVKSAANAGDEIARAAPMLGLSVEEFQKYRYAAKLAGVENENFAGTVQLLLRNVSEAQKGNKEIGKSFAQVGISVASLKGQSTNQVLRSISDGLTKIPNQADRIAVSMDLMGRSGARMGAFLAKGTSEMDALMSDAEAFGMFTEETAKNADDMNDAWDRVAFFISGIKNEFIALAPIFTGVLDDMREWLNAHRDVIKSGLVRAIALIGAVIKTVWRAAKAIVRVFQAMIKVLGGFENAIKLLGVVVLSALMALLGPVAALASGILFLVAVLMKLKSNFSRVITVLAVLTPLLILFSSSIKALTAMKILGWLTSLTAGFRALATTVIIPTLGFLALAAALAFVFLAAEDITTWFLGGKSVIGEWLGPWSEIPDKLKKIWDKIKAVFVSGGKFIAAVFRGDFAEAYKILEAGAVKVKAAVTDKNRGPSPETPGAKYMNYANMMSYGGGGFAGSNSFAGGGAVREKIPFSARKFVAQYSLGTGADGKPQLVDRGAGAGNSGTKIGKVEMSLNLAPGTTSQQAEEIAQLVDKRLSQHIDHSLQQSSGPGD